MAITACLSRPADMYLLDEPSAHLDVEQRMMAAKVKRRFAESGIPTSAIAIVNPGREKNLVENIVKNLNQ